jgi:thymidylate synthase ThyX
MAAPDSNAPLTTEERAKLAHYFTQLDANVFALTNLPEVVKGALFARYSRSPKSLRRLFADEFAVDVQDTGVNAQAQALRAEALYEKVFVEYGDDSVAQLGGVHLAVEGASNILTKVLEWGRLMAYLEQSTRYIPYTDKPNGQWRYVVPPELDSRPELRAQYVKTLDHAFETYTALIERMVAHYKRKFPCDADTSEGVWTRTLRAKALDTVRGLLPAATKSNVGLYGTGQAFESLLLRMRAHPLAEVRQCADEMLAELRKVIPAFLKRVDQPERGVRWSRYFSEAAAQTKAVASRVLASADVEDRAEVTLTEFDPDGEAKVLAAILYSVSELPDDQLLRIARNLSDAEKDELLRSYVGDRANRRHKPGRAFERTSYRFDILSDYGAFRDLQRHRMCTLEWQPLSTHHGYSMPVEIDEAGEEPAWRAVMDSCAELYEALVAASLPEVASYAVPMAYRVRYYMQMNVREAMHIIELRTTPQGHPSYRRVCQQMHKLIAEVAGHRSLARAMQYVDHSAVELERLNSEKAIEKRQQKALGATRS